VRAMSSAVTTVATNNLNNESEVGIPAWADWQPSEFPTRTSGAAKRPASEYAMAHSLLLLSSLQTLASGRARARDSL